MAKHYKTIIKAILLSLAVGGAITLTAVAPHATGALLSYLQKQRRLKNLRSKKNFYDALYRIRKSRLLIISEKKDGVFKIELTENGKKKVREIQFEDLQIPRPKEWDGIWRIVLFDIPNAKNKARDALRQKLKSLGFFKFQESTWAFPYPCNREIEFLVELFGVYRFVQIVEAHKVQNDIALKKHFKLF